MLLGVQDAKRGIHPPQDLWRIGTAGSGTLQIQVRGSFVTLIYGFFMCVCGEPWDLLQEQDLSSVSLVLLIIVKNEVTTST